MKAAIYPGLIILFFFQQLIAQPVKSKNSFTQKKDSMITGKLTNPTVRATIEALQKSDEKAWFANFTSNAELYDDGNKHDFTKWSSGVIKGRELLPALIK